MKEFLLGAEGGQDMHDEWEQHFQDAANYELLITSSTVLLKNFPAGYVVEPMPEVPILLTM